jgi:hypothetical protein
LILRSRCFLQAVVLISFFLIVQSAFAQTSVVPAHTETAAPKTSQAPVVDLSGDWQVSWEVRLGADSGTLHLKQEGEKLTGTFKDLHGDSPVSGTVVKNQITFDVKFEGKYPFTTRFIGNVNDGKMSGSSQAVDVAGGGGAYLGHGGEVVHPEHPWSAARSVVSASEK